MKSLDQFDELMFSGLKTDKKDGSDTGDADKPYVTWKEGAAFYSMSVPTFKVLSKTANAVRSFDGGTFMLVDIDVFETFLEQKRTELHKLI